MKIIVCGDIHCDWGALNNLINSHKPDIILQCGDFGWWPHIHNKFWDKDDRKPYNQFGIKNKDTIIYWCDGNHENHEDIIIQKNNNIFDFAGKNIIYQPRGSILTIEDKNILFFGGANSIDKKRRTEGVSWWRDELPSIKDMYYMEEQILKLNKKIDIVISHTAPNIFIQELGFDIGDKKKDPTCQFLDFILNNYCPKYWYFGHFHKAKRGYNKGCKWFALSHTRMNMWWIEL